MEWKTQKGQTVVPVFYHVDPSDVRNQTGSFGEAFDNHQKVPQDKVMRWKAALRAAANLSGWHVQHGYESQATQRIVQDILSRNLKLLHVGDKLIGMERRMKEMASRISIDSNDVRMIGIYGMDGIGKTTLAKVVYNEIAHLFDGASFLLNISSQKPNLLQLQNQLLRDILGEDIPSITDISEGTHVLVVLDDVDHIRQIYFLVYNCRYFGPGSRIILTSRYKRLFLVWRVDESYMVEELNCKEAIQLFSLHAFHMNSPQKGFIDLSRRIVDYCKGLPIALEVLAAWEIIREQYPDEPGNWSRLWDPEDVHHVLTKNTLRYLHWDGWTLESLPSNFDGEKLGELSLRHSSLKYLWKRRKRLPKLVVIDLGNSQQLDLEFENCKMLHYFPSITGLESLKVLNLSGCSKIDKFPEIQGCMENLLELNLEGTAIVELPPSVVSREVSGNHGGYGMFTRASFRWNIYKRVVPLNCSSKRPSSYPLGDVKDQHLTPGFYPFYSDLSGCNLTDGSINDNLGRLSFLEELNLSRNNLVTISEEFYLHSRHSTYRLPLAFDNVTTILEKLHQNFLPEIEYSIFLPGSTIPEWFQHPSIGSSVTIDLPPNWHNKDFLGFALCSVFSLEEDEIIQGPGLICCNFEFKEGPYLSSSISWTHSGDRVVETDHIWLVYQPGAKLMIPKSSSLNKFRKITAYFSLSGASHVVKNCGIHLIYARDKKVNQQTRYTSAKRSSDGSGYYCLEETQPKRLRGGEICEEGSHA
ncbi:hypothetical protein AAG906_021098 [Vitis piasezkii]